MQTATTIGLDIAKSVFQVHGIDAEGKVVIRRQLKRRYVLAFFQKLPPCMIGIEACARRDDAGCLLIRRQPPDARPMLLA
jgi:transposase